jgi:hypothetical protein
VNRAAIFASVFLDQFFEFRLEQVRADRALSERRCPILNDREPQAGFRERDGNQQRAGMPRNRIGEVVAAAVGQMFRSQLRRARIAAVCGDGFPTNRIRIVVAGIAPLVWGNRFTRLANRLRERPVGSQRLELTRPKPRTACPTGV